MKGLQKKYKSFLIENEEFFRADTLHACYICGKDTSLVHIGWGDHFCGLACVQEMDRRYEAWVRGDMAKKNI